eukprot:267483_1
MDGLNFLKSLVNEGKKTQRPQKRKYATRGELEQKKKPCPDPHSPSIPESCGSRISKDDNSDSDNEKEEKFLTMPLHEVITRLRTLGKPITYFGEDCQDRQKRLRRLEVLHHERETSSKGRRNVMQDMEEEVEKEIMHAHATGKSDDYKEYEKAKKEKLLKYDRKRSREEFDNTEDYVLFFFKRMLREWEHDLESRSITEKRTPQYKRDRSTQKQTRQYIRPLFKLLKRKECPGDILEATEQIVRFSEEREYVQANDIYLQMSIGNAPWPMGVTMVGIHERSGRSKIFSSQIAHVLNDENQRKYIQSMKRLVTYSQKKYPNPNPHKNFG